MTAICAACFTLRAVIVAWSAIDSADADLVCSVEPESLLSCLPCGSASVAPQLLRSRYLVFSTCLLGITLPSVSCCWSQPSFCRGFARPTPISGLCIVVQDVLNHPFLNLIYYTACELVPSALVLYILRKLPPRRSQQGYQQIPVR